MPDITAKINVNTQSGPQQVAVTLPSAQAAANTSLQLKLLGDVDTTTLNDGSLLQYRAVGVTAMPCSASRWKQIICCIN